ncbi:hypothetical protein EG329_006604 [Mollisiaceae sp. DMI_Dod_QoI]|nr:hypothetical protein EG329_006604 [Helotiales sp. DMI_Dod_QoI]
MVILAVNQSRYEAQKGQLKAMLFECGIMGMHSNGVPDLDTCVELLDKYDDSLLEDPLLLVTLIFKRFERIMRMDFSSFCKDLYRTEGMLGVTKRADWLRQQGYTVGSNDYDDINAKLYRNQIDAAKLHSRCEILRGSAKNFELICRRLEKDCVEKDLKQDQKADKRMTEVGDMVRRLGIDLSELEYAQKRLQSQFSILYNLINQRDSRLGTG